MPPEKFKRKLTAILSADVKGYSSLMGTDEEATLRTLQDDWKAVFGITDRTVVCPEKAGMFSRSQSCWGKSQKPVA